MKNNLIKKYIVLFTGMVYLLSYFLQSISFLDFGLILNKTYAENQLEYTNLVAIFVDDKIYDNLSNDLKRYAQSYIQGENSGNRYNAISNSKAIVMPIDTENVDAVDITKILENMYFDGISGKPSKLVGTVLIGDISLPVVNQDGYIYPTIYPYVDFEEQKFIWNEKDGYFVYNDNPNGQAEIWHGIINFDNVSEYQNYFEKLKSYSENPNEYIGKNIWYDDLIANKKYFYKEALNSYINNFLFAEDLGYHRYTDLMVGLMQESHNDMIAELLSGFDGMEELQTASASMNTPTMTLETMITDGYLKSYTSLIGGKQLDNIVKNVETANRRVEQYTGSDGELKSRTALDTHYLKMEQKDETLLRLNGGIEPLIITFNNVLEDILNDKIEQEKYWMNEVIPLTYLRYDGDKKFDVWKPWKFKYVWKDYSAFENYFFGINAKNLNNMQETSAYRGTYRNFDDIYGLTIDDIQTSEYPASDIDDKIDLNKKSIGGSYDIFATQVDANRGYNITNTVNELELYDDNKIAQRDYWNTKCDKKFLGICWVKRRWESDQSPDDHLCNPGNTEEEGGCEMPASFAMRNWGGASPLNLSGMDERTIAYNFQDAIMPVFDIAGSKEIENEEPAANSFEGVKEYSRLIQKTFVPNQRKYWTKNADRLEPDLPGKGYNTSMGEDMKFTNRMPVGDLDNPTWIYTEPKLANSVDFFEKFDGSAHWETGNIIKIIKETDNNEIGKGEIFTYRTLDSRVKNNKSTSEDVNGSSFFVFKDPQSPSKIFYEGILDKIDRTNDNLEININTIKDLDDGSIKKNLSELSDIIENIDSNFDNIISYNIYNLNSLSGTEIDALANDWKNTYVENDRNKIKEKSEEIEDQFVDFNGFVENFTFDNISNYIENELYNFDINNWDLIFLSSWKNTIQTNLLAIKYKFYGKNNSDGIDDFVNAAKNQYENIIKLPTNLITILANKKSNINNLQVNSDENGIACENDYKSLCKAIDDMIVNLTNFNVNEKIEEISDFEFGDEDENGNAIPVNIKPFEDIIDNINNSSISTENNNILVKVNSFESSTDTELRQDIPGMNITTSDRPIDSPKYITFKGIGGDKVKFIYPNIYKSEVFDGETNNLILKEPDEISEAIKDYLRESVKKYNEYLTEQKNKKNTFYNQNAIAYNLLASKDILSSPNRDYNLMDEDFLINELEAKLNNGAFFSGQMGGYEPIEFIAHMLYYQNIARKQKQLGDTILEDMDNSRTNFDINNKITHIIDNYLIKDNNKGNFITPAYRDNGYEVAFINSDGADYITYKDESAFVKRIKTAAKNFVEEESVAIEQTQLEEEIQNECNIPTDGAVMLFDLQEGGSPWLKAVQCWWEKIKEKPFEFEFNRESSQGPIFTLGNDSNTILGEIGDNILPENTQSLYMKQLDLLDVDDENQEVLDNSNPGDYQKLEKIISYTKLEIDNQNINADIASGKINISSSVELGDVEFFVQNIGDSKISISDNNGVISSNISLGSNDYSTGTFTIEPFDTKLLNFNISNPIDGTNVLVFNICLPGTQNINNCVKKTLRLNVIPGEISEIKLETPGNKILEESQIPIYVKGIDAFGNNVGQLILERFNISVSTGSLSQNGKTDSIITFSDFDKSNFVLNADEGIVDGTDIEINIDGKIGGIEGIYASGIISVVKGNLDIYYNENIINTIDPIEITLPAKNNYSYKDDFNLTQTNLETVPKLKLNLVDNNGQKINIESILKISSKNGLIVPGNIESRSITKTEDNMTFEVEQNRFKNDNSHIIQSGETIVYLMPNFKAGEDILSISMPGIDDIQIPVIINPAPASIVEISTKKDEISTNSQTSANLMIMDNWRNIITQNTTIKLGTIGPISISGFDGSSDVISVENGELKFDINSQEEGGVGFVYATIDSLDINEQKPGYKQITVQKKMLPEHDLNIMYLNLFGSDWGNQWGYMSDNNKYIENLINNSEKLLAATTQLVSPEKIKKYVIIANDDLQINNIDDKEIDLKLNGTNQQIIFETKDVGNIYVDSDSFDIKEVDVSDENLESVIDTLIDNKYDNKNILLYLPEDLDSIIESNEIKNNAIYINNENIFDLENGIFDNQLSIKLSKELISKYQIRNAFVGDKQIGKILISIKNKQNLTIETLSINNKYDYNEIWVNGSTRNKGWGLYEIESSLPDNTIGYDSIQNSIDSTLGLGFVADFKNVTNFGAGDSVGKSTIPFSSEFLINIGDPLLKRINENESAKIYDEEGILDKDTGFDKGLGNLIYSEPGKTIFKVINIDFNNDGLEDVIVSFTDGTIKILKNYGGNEPFEKLGDLMILADGIKDIIIGDVDGNGYEDIIFWTKSDLLRVYKNDEGVFDVDGYPICLNTNVKNGMISENPENIGDIFQIFFEDMDQDDKLDIITNDKLGYIKIFYGGKNNIFNEDNYVSNNKFNCDDNWYKRQSYKDNTNMVYRFGIRINESTKVLDQGLIHREGINPDNDVNITAEDLGVNTDLFGDNMNEDNISDLLGEAMNFDTENAVQIYRGSERYKEANFGIIPVYEDVERENELEYVEMGCLTGEDPIKIYKQYDDINGDILENGDKVQVNITIKANDDFVGTFIDNIKGPWIIPLTGENDMIESFWFDSGVITQDTIDNELVFNWDMVNARYMIDNIHMNALDEIKIHYWVYYDGNVQNNEIEIKDINGLDYERGANDERGDFLDEYVKDEYPDIKMKPSDGCNKSMFILFNEDQEKNYSPEYVDLTELLMDYSNGNQENYDNTMSEITNTLGNNSTSNDDPNFDNIPGLDSMIESWGSMDILGDNFDIQNIISQGGVDLSEIANVPSQIIDGLLGDVMDRVDELMGGMCDGFDLSKFGIGGSSNCGLPVPFNQGFLGPGNYHLFGCFDIPPLTEILGKGWPVLNIPGNWPGPSPSGYLPIPGLFGFPFRGPGDGFLGGPQSGIFPSRFRLYLVPTLTAEIGIAMCFGPYSVGTAIPDPFSSIGGNCVVVSIPLPCKNAGITNPNQTNQIPEAYLDLETCSNSNVPCFVGEGESTSSFELVSSSSNSSNMTAAIPDGSFAGGFINIEKEPITEYDYNTPESGIEINGIKLIGGADSDNKIIGGQAQGLIKAISKMRLDKQIKYITSNLTNFKVDVAWPDFAGMMGGMGNGGLSGALADAKKQDCLDEKGSWDAKTQTCEVSDKQKCENKGMERKDQTNTCLKKISPNQNEDALGKIDTWAQNNLLDRKQITNISDTSFANPFEKLEAMFKEVPLINITTENITVKVPIISSEDITSYVSLSRTWIDNQKKVLKEWQDFLSAMIGICGGDGNISNMTDLKNAYYDLKDKLQNELENEVQGIDNQIKEKKEALENIVNDEEKEVAQKELTALENQSSNAITSNIKKMEAINYLNNKYNLNALGKYSLFESCDSNQILIRVGGNDGIDTIIKNDIYLSYIVGGSDELTMFTKGYDLIKTNTDNSTKTIIEYQRNNDLINNNNLCLKTFGDGEKNQCIDLFLGGKFEDTLDDFINIQTSANQLIASVKQNIETLDLYKKFPLDLYEWIHVGDRYMSEISSIVNNFLGTISLWMKTNATRYSQYVDSLILIMTTIQTYQAIIDLSVNWSDRCSSCTNDNYDQFACKLGLLCPDNLPILKIPPMKIPNIYIDLSNINLATDIKLPKFNFVPTSVPLPDLPNIPNPPTIDMSLNLDGMSAGTNIIKSLMIQLEKLDVSINLPSIPVIPAPPDLPEIPSFIPSVKLELPVLPPAPKIPELPNEIQTTIDIAEIIGKILCIVKANIGLVGEDSIKAKVEQMSQRTYEVPYWDNLDQTLSERNDVGGGSLPSRLTDTFGFLNSDEFADVELKGFDIGIESEVNLQYNFAGFYTFIDQIVGEVNKVSSMPGDLMQAGVNWADEQSKELEKRMSACASNPISEECLGDGYTQELKDAKENLEFLKNEIIKMADPIENGFNGVKEAIQLIESKENKINKTPEDIKELEKLHSTYDAMIEGYNNYINTYNDITKQYNEIQQWMSSKVDEVLGFINEQISSADDFVDSAANFDKIEEWNAKIQEKMDEFDLKQTIRREQRSSNMESLYKEISYIDYNEDTYRKNIKILKNSLYDIKSKSINESFNNEIDNYIKLANLENNITPASDSMHNIMQQYTNVINQFKDKNDDLVSTIGNDYDKFLAAVAKNDVTLVGDNDINISLSTNLFDIDKNTLNILKQQENINKVYLDYENKNIDGYINALENNSIDELNMDEEQYKKNKEYLYKLKDKTNLAYNILDTNNNKISDKKLIAQSNSNTSNSTSSNSSYTDISSYIDGKVIKTIEGSFDLANDQYVTNFQGRSLMVDINNDNENDLILWDQSNIYIKYRDGNNNYDNIDYIDNYYEYDISSYENLLNDSEEGFIQIRDIKIKLCDGNWEVKNFEYNGGNFDSIKVKWMNSNFMGDNPKGYLIKMIHRVDLFNDKEIIVSNNNKDLFDKKYVLALPTGAPLTGTKISLEEGTYRTTDIMSGLIFDVMYYNENQTNIDLTIKDIPRNWQYSEIYTLDMYEDILYFINNSSSNQIVAGPQIIADNKGPVPTITLYRPATNEIINTGANADCYVSTNYILQANWEDNVSIEKLWIADENGNTLNTEEGINQKTGYIELSNLFFTGANLINYYFGAIDTNGNSQVTQVTLNIKVPQINIVKIEKYGNEIENITSPATITAEIDNDLDEGYVQFNRFRNNKRQIITGTLGGIERDKYNLTPKQTIITGGYYDFGNEIGLYLQNGDLAAKIDPDNGKIWILNGFENLVNLELGYNTNSPMITLREAYGNALFSILLPTKDLVNIVAPSLKIENLNGDIFGDFNGGKVIIKNDESRIYVGPKGQIYTEMNVYGNYSFDEQNQTVKYSIKDNPNGSDLGYIEVKIANLLGE